MLKAMIEKFWGLFSMNVDETHESKKEIVDGGMKNREGFFINEKKLKRTNIPTDPHTVTTTDLKTNMRHIHTSIVSMHLATRGNNKILRTPPPHTSSSEAILPRLTRRTLAQLRTNKSPFFKSYLHKVDAKTHPDGRRSWLVDHKREHRTPPTSKGHGSG